MKTINKLTFYLLLSCAAVVLTGCLCKKKKKNNTKLSYSEMSLKKNKKHGKRHGSDDITEYGINDAADDLKLGNNSSEFQKVYFGFDKTNITNDQKLAVDYDAKLAQRVTTDKDSAIMIIGKADTHCKSELYNTAVSQHRADVIKQEFAVAGIDTSKIRTLGVGDTQLEVQVYGKEPLNRCAVVQEIRV